MWRLFVMWRLSLVRFAAFATFAACATAPAPSPGSGPVRSASTGCKGEGPLGEPEQFTLRAVPGFTISEPVICKAGAYIRVERLSGSHKLGTARVGDGGFREGCMDLSNPAACPTINYSAVVREVARELHAEGVESGGEGAGPCAPDLAAGYSGWNMSTGVHAWSDTDRLVAKIAEVMDRYDIAGYLGASVYTIPCVEAL